MQPSGEGGPPPTGKADGLCSVLDSHVDRLHCVSLVWSWKNDVNDVSFVGL